MHVIEGINFSIWSANDIRRESVVHITEKKTIENGVYVENGLRDPRMGGQKICPTCGESTIGLAEVGKDRCISLHLVSRYR